MTFICLAPPPKGGQGGELMALAEVGMFMFLLDSIQGRRFLGLCEYAKYLQHEFR